LETIAVSLKTYISAWICVCIVLSALGRFVDYLLNTKLRTKEKARVQEFFGRLFIIINKANFIDLQQLMIEWIIKLKNKTFGHKFLTCRFIIVSLLISQYLTLTAFTLGQLSDKEAFVRYNYANLIPLLPFTGFSFVFIQNINVISLLALIGLYWNNYLFDCLAIMSTYILLKFAYNKKNYFAIVASFDIMLSYVFAYLCIFTYFITPPNSNVVGLEFTSFIPDIWNRRVVLPHMWLFYSLTTFVPIAIYMSILLFFSVCKLIQWIAATVTSDFSEEDSKTVFFKLASALSVTAFALTQILTLIWKAVTQ
jgi:hypothetical protein